MSRRFVSGAVIAAISALAFTATSFAVRAGSGPALPPDVPAANLPTVALTDAQKVAISDEIQAPVATRFGIGADSFNAARLVASTSLGPLYLIPGSSGACLALANAVSCGDPGATGVPLLALAVSDGSSGFWVGGGIATAATAAVTVRDRSGHSQRFATAGGVFAIPASAGLNAQDPLVFEAESR